MNWPDEGDRALASRCAVGKELLELNEDVDEHIPQANYQEGRDPPKNAIDTIDPANSEITVPCVPGGVPTQGITTLDAWAVQTAAAEAQGRPPGAWLPGFLDSHAASLPAAVRAADFFGCQLFLELMLEVQLLRVALLGNKELREAVARGGSPSSWALSSLHQADCLRLPCIRVAANTQRSGGAGLSTGDGSGDGGGRGVASTQPETTPQTTAPEAGAAADSDAASVRAQWDDMYGPVLPLDPGTGTAAAAGAAAAGPPRGGGGSGSGSGSVRDEASARLLRWLTPAEMEALVRLLEDSSLLKHLGATRSDIRRCLYRLGVRPVLVDSRATELCVTNSKVPYVQLLLPPPSAPAGGLPEVGPDGSGAEAHYEVEAVTVGAESHDQGWSSYPENHNTYENSWTWAEVLLRRADGSLVRRPGPGAATSAAAEPGRLYTNLHAVRRWQSHLVALGPDSSLVQDLNGLVFGPAAAAATATGSGGEGAGGVEGAADARQQQQQRPAGTADAAPGGPFRLELLICAAFPGWAHHVRRVEVAVHLRPVGCGGDDDGGECSGGAGGGGEAAAEGVGRTAKQRHSLLFQRPR